MHIVDTSLAAGFYCSKTGPQNQVVINDIQKIRNFNAGDMVYHVTSIHSTAFVSVNHIVLIEPDKKDLSIYFIESKHETDSTLHTNFSSIHHRISQDDISLVNSNIISATVDNYDSEFVGSVQVNFLMSNEFDGCIFSGKLSGYPDSHGELQILDEKWTLQYEFKNSLRYQLLTVKEIHMIFAIEEKHIMTNASEAIYNIIAVTESRGLVSVHSVKRQMIFDHQTQMYGTYPFNVSIHLDSTYCFISFVHFDGFTTTYDVKMWQPVNSMQIDQIDVKQNLFQIVLHSRFKVDLFDLFKVENLFFVDNQQQQFGIIHVKYTQCSVNQYSDASTGFECKCLLNYKRSTLSNECIECDPFLTECCGSMEECSRKTQKCGHGFRLSIHGNCVLCDETSYCVGSEEFKCAKKSRALQSGTYETIKCICEAGFFQQHGACIICQIPFFCQDNVNKHCPPKMETTKSGAAAFSDCECSPGYSVYSPGTECQEIPQGSYWTLDNLSQKGSAEECPNFSTTKSSKSVGKSSCKCAPGFQEHETIRYKCIECIKDNQICLFNSKIMNCAKIMKQKNSLRHDKCICIDGYYNVNNDQTQNEIVCELCLPGYYCSSESSSPIMKCPDSMSSAHGATSAIFCFCQNTKQLAYFNEYLGHNECRCNEEFYSIENQCIQCPHNMYVPFIETSISTRVGFSTCVCKDGFMLQNSRCVPCAVGFFCNSRARPPILPCPFGTFSPVAGLRSARQCLSCPHKTDLLDENVQWKNPRTSILTCLGDFVYFNSNINTNLYKSVFIFSVQTDILNILEINRLGHTMFNQENYDIDYTFMKGIVTYTITMKNDFINEFTLKLLASAGIWSDIVAASKINSMSYIYVIHSIFCSVFSMISNEFFMAEVSQSRCFVPFHHSKFQSVPQVQRISDKFIQGKSSLFVNQRNTIVPVLLFKELVSVYNTLDSVFDMGSEYPLVLFPVPGNGLAVFSDNGPLFKYKITKIEFMSKIKSQLSTEKKLILELGNCQHAISSLFGECAISSSVSTDVKCSYCEPDISYFDNNLNQCTFCTPKTSSDCISCCQNRDTQCQDEDLLENAPNLCGNGIHEFSEECDTSDLNSPLNQCCLNCKIKTGFYMDPPCSTRCGDFQVAQNIEECDSPGDFSCNMYTCRKILLQKNSEL